MKTKSELRQHKLFVEDHIVKAVLRVSLPAIVIALMVGLYIFADQVMMVNLIPHFRSSESLYSGDLWNQFQEVIANNPDIHITNYDTATIIRTAVAYSAPIPLVINAAALLIGNGASINFNRYNGQGNLQRAESSWAIGFWSNMIWGILISALMIGLSQVLVNIEQGHQLSTSLNELKSKFGGETEAYKIVEQVYNAAYANIKTYAVHYMYIIAAGTIFALYTQFLSMLIISEGKQVFVVVSAIICNAITVLLDWVFIQYAKMEMTGAAIAMLIGWTLNATSYLSYILFMDRHGDTNLHIKSLGRMKSTLQAAWFGGLVWSIFSLGLPSFLRNISMALATATQLAILAYVIGVINKHTGTTYTNSDYQDLYGAVNPIYSLFYTATVGIINGGRITLSYNYGAHNMKRVRQSYWLIGIIGAIWGTIILLIVSFGVGTPLLQLFNIHDDKMNKAKYLLWIVLAGLPIFGAQMGGMVLFQATNQWWRASICGIMQGIICNFTISFAIMGIAMVTNSIDMFLWNTFIVLAVAVIIVVAWSAVYMYKHYKDPIKVSTYKNI